MPDVHVSRAVGLACNLAEQEALRSGCNKVQPIHMMIGLCSLDKCFSPTLEKKPPLERHVLDMIGVEWSFTMSAFTDACVNPVHLRRKLRSRLSKEASETTSRTVALSDASCSVLRRAGEIGDSSQTETAELVNLLRALLEDQDTDRELRAAGVDVDRLVTHVASRSESLGESMGAAGYDFGASFSDALQPGVDKYNKPSLVVRQQQETSDSTRSFATIFEACSLCQAGQSIDSLAQKALERVLEVIPAARRGVIIGIDSSSGGLLLKAHFPPGSPIVSLSSAREAMQEKKAFVWIQQRDPQKQARTGVGEEGLYAPLIWRDQVYGAICLDNEDTGQSFTINDLELMTSFGYHLGLVLADWGLSHEARRKDTLIEHLMMSFSPNIRARVIQQARQGRLRPGGQRSEVSIVFSDIRGFTATTATMDADDIAEMLNEYLSALTEPIVSNNGTIDKYIGDAVLSVFGSPDTSSHPHESAMKAAIEMQAAIHKINDRRRGKGQITCEVGIGIHCGEVFHGLIGTAERIEFTVIGDAVNRTSRYCSAAQAGEVLISPDFYQRVWQLVEAEPLTIPTKHEGNIAAYRVKHLRDDHRVEQS